MTELIQFLANLLDERDRIGSVWMYLLNFKPSWTHCLPNPAAIS